MRNFIFLFSFINLMFLIGCSKKMDVPENGDIVFKCEGERAFLDFNQRKKAEQKQNDAISDYHMIEEVLILYANRSGPIPPLGKYTFSKKNSSNSSKTALPSADNISGNSLLLTATLFTKHNVPA